MAVQGAQGAPDEPATVLPNGTVAHVHTAADLHAALARGAPHIEIRQHIDLRGLGAGAGSSFAVGCGTRSIRVRLGAQC